ncbi:MAG: hypothetical protein ABEJ67_03340 [Halanaeroarchaeum sp.]
MSNPFFAGFSFRTKTPSFEPGQEIEVMVTGRDDDDVIARVGDTILAIDDPPADPLDTRIRAEVTTFDEKTHRGRATYLETVGTSSF